MSDTSETLWAGEVFRVWTPRLLTTLCGLSPAEAGLASIVYPLAGATAAVTAGALADALGPERQPQLLGGFVCALVVALSALYAVSSADTPPSAAVALALVTAVGFAVVGPFSIMAGLLPYELGGRRQAATVVSVLDCTGYLGSAAGAELTGLLFPRFGARNPLTPSSTDS